MRFNPLSFDPVADLRVGGLDEEIRGLFRRIFAPRAIPVAVFGALGMSHVRGVLLHGPPGESCGGGRPACAATAHPPASPPRPPPPPFLPPVPPPRTAAPPAQGQGRRYSRGR